MGMWTDIFEIQSPRQPWH